MSDDHPFRKAYPTEFPYFTDMGLDKNIARVEKLDEQSFFVTPRSLLDVLFGFGIVCEGQHRRFVEALLASA